MYNFNKGTTAMIHDRLGMFVHFGIYSALAGKYKGVDVVGKSGNSHGEWIMRNAEIPIEEYNKFIPEFVPDIDWADNLARNAKNAGMRYIVLTSKHHDGFSLFKSEASDYNIYNYLGRDLVKELADACKKYGLKLGLYYSQCLDWHEPDAAGKVYMSGVPANNTNFWDFPENNAQNLQSFFERKVFPQVREILTNYGDLSLIWFDFPHDITPEDSKTLADFVHSIQPNCAINARIGHHCGDYLSLADNQLPCFPADIPVECLITLNHTWGYKENDHNYKSPKTVIDILARCVAGNTTLLVNVGPRKDGSLTEETLEILKELGKWTEENKEALFDSCGNPFRLPSFPFGLVTQDKNFLYLFVNNSDCKLAVMNGISGAKLIGAHRIGGKAVSAQLRGDRLTVSLDDNNGILPVYAVEFDKTPDIAKKCIEIDGSIILPITFAEKLRDGVPELFYTENEQYNPEKGTYGLAQHLSGTTLSWLTTNEALKWDFEVRSTGRYGVYLEIGRNEYEGGYKLTLDDTTVVIDKPEAISESSLNESNLANTRYIYPMGEYDIDKEGTHTITISKTEIGRTIPLAAIRLQKL